MDSTVLAQFATPPEPAAQRVSPEDWQRLGEMQDTAREVGERLAEVRERLGLEPDEAEREARAFLGTHYGRGHTTDVQYLATLLRAAEARGRERGLEDGIDACEREAGSLPVDWRARAEEAESRLEYAQWREQYEAAVAYKARAEEAERLLAEAREVLRSLDRGFVNETTCEECHNRVAENFERFAESLTEDVLAQLYPTYAAKRKAGVRG